MALSPVPEARNFPKTPWSLISRIRNLDPTERRNALDEFCRIYWIPLYGFARGKGNSPHDGQDLVQGFIARLIDSPGSFEKLDPESGMLRHWLRKSFHHYMITMWKKSQAQKRGGGAEILELDLESGEQRIEASLEQGIDPERAFDQQWARTVLSRARRRLRDAFAADGREEEFGLLRPCLDANSDLSSSEIGKQLGKSAGAVRMAISRLRIDYGKAIREEIGHTLGPKADVDDEMKYLLECL